MKINYIVSRKTRKPHCKSKLETKHGSIESDFSWEQQGDIRSQIRSANPGWDVAGYCQAPRDIQVHGSILLVTPS